MMRTADKVVCNSQFAASTLPTEGKTRAIVVDNPFASEEPAPNRSQARRRLIEELGVDETSRIIGFVGNLTYQKRPEVYLEAAALLHEHTNFLVFPLFGSDRDGQKRNLEQRAFDLGIGDIVFFMGFRRPIEEWIAACDLILAPGRDDAFGRSLVEAMLVGTPVVASRSGGHETIIRDGDTGFLVDPDDPSAFADAALKLLDRPDLAADFAKKAYTESVRRYSVRAHVERIGAIYDVLLNRETRA